MSEKPIIAIVSITIPTLASFYVGIPYIGSLTGNIAYLLSVLFLIVFVTANVLHRQKIEDLSKGKSYFICIAYLSAIPLIYLINSLKPPSIFLISLFFLYFFLALMWTVIAEKRMFTNVCIVLFILCLLPLICGLSIHMIYEAPICDEIKYLENQKEYYEYHFNDLNYGILTQDRTHSAKNDIRELEENIEEATGCYLVADFSGAWKKIEEGNKNNNYLKKTFELLDPEKALYDELRGLDKDLAQLNSRAYGIEERLKPYYPEEVYKVERILSDINITMNKSDEAWFFFRNGEYKETYESILQINADISDIKERLDRIEILIPAAVSWSLIIIVFIITLIIIGAGAYYYTEKKRLR